MATCAEIVGAKLPDNAGEDSVSILPACSAPRRRPLREATIHQSLQPRPRHPPGTVELVFTAKGTRELYDLKSDLGETKDLAAANPETVERLAALMRKHIADGRSTPGAPQKNDSPLSVDAPPPGKKKKANKPATK
jgi:arylsulfatase A